MSNEWKKPPAAPPPLFLGKKERDLVKQINDELIEKIIGQQILYYSIDMKSTNFHELYGEAIEKTFLPPIRVYALILLITWIISELIKAGRSWSISIREG